MRERADSPRQSKNLIRKWAAVWGLPGLEGAVAVSFDARIRRSLGRCAPEQGRITLHPALRGAPRARLAEVLCHEAAHVAAFVLYGPLAKPHGPEWAQLVTRAGFSPTTRATALAPPVAKAVSSKRSRVQYEHRCSVCQAVRWALRPVPQWRCAECVDAGLSGEMVIERRSRAPGSA